MIKGISVEAPSTGSTARAAGRNNNISWTAAAVGDALMQLSSYDGHELYERPKLAEPFLTGQLVPKGDFQATDFLAG